MTTEDHPPAGDAASVSAVVVPNEQGTEDLVISGGGADAAQFARDVEAAFNLAIKEQMRRSEFSGRIEIVVPASIPASERKHITSAFQQLRDLCSQLSTGTASYRLTVKYAHGAVAAASPADEAPAMTASSFTHATGRATGRYAMRVWFMAGVVVVVGAAIAYTYKPAFSFAFPDTVEYHSIDYGDQQLQKARSWTADGNAGALFLIDGEKLPNARVQLGTIVSRERASAAILNAWIREQYYKSKTTQTYYDSGAGEEECKAGLASFRDDVRAFMAVQLCRTGDRIAGCAEDDEPIPEPVLAHCLNGAMACWEDACTSRLHDNRDNLSAVLDRLLASK